MGRLSIYGSHLVTLIKDLGMQPQGNRTRRFWLVECSCGVQWTARADYMKKNSEALCDSCKGKKSATTHGGYKEKLNAVWRNMRGRVNNVNNPHYKDYGGRGISIASEWDKYVDFKAWALRAGYGREPNLSLDRIDNDGDYTPLNCRWATIHEQNINKRNSIKNRYVEV